MVTYQLIPADLYDGYKAVVGVGVFFFTKYQITTIKIV